MEKWADEVIVAVHYSNSKANKVINTLKIFDDEGDKLSSGRTRSRENVISDIKNGTTYVTAYKSKESTQSTKKYNKGKKVIVYPVKSKDYIKTERNEKTEDNLDKIEEF
ncbi:hypothetical protein AKG30_14220 (plasmid) [Lacticaseibacillus paracasei]|uniref:DUF3892 domain-containing protein n=1 Tax=Lacticaseibacillus paracasei TaxID=1597 RepID=UPI00067FB921|nr:DUF3892 domain-containing protein [Lacticaseibacillus paracasei]AKU36113.1 hypothetical protein AKG30_14220 [Lacticaseibacillus paracasei]